MQIKGVTCKSSRMTTNHPELAKLPKGCQPKFGDGVYSSNVNFLGIHMFNSKTSASVVFTIATAAALLIGAPASAQSSASNKAPQQLASQDPAKDQIYGWQVMSDSERDAYKKQIASFKNTTERDVFLQDHRARMNSRAREKGITLRDTTVPSTQNAGSPSSAISIPNDASKSGNNTATQMRPGTGAGPYKDK